VGPRAASARGCSAALITVLFLLLPLAGAARAETVRVSVDPARKGPLVEDRFIGLSFEVAELPAVARNSRRGNLVALLRSLGPGLLRFGGISADGEAAFSAHGEAPAWATTRVTPRDFARLRTLAQLTGWRVLLTLPLGHYSPRLASREAAAAARRLGPALSGFEIGNEPNAFWLIGLRPPSYSYLDYRSEVASYRQAIALAAPGVPIVGPATVPQLGGPLWLSAFARDERPALLTPHYYARNACTMPGLSVSDLLSAPVAAQEDEIIDGYAAIARAYKLPLRLGETNNVACAGQPGVSDTFAAALWALRYMLAIARSGLAGANFHTLLDRCNGYSPVCARSRNHYRRGRLRAMPEWYALLLFRELVGQRLVGLSVSRQRPGLIVEALRTAEGEVEVVAVNTTPGSHVSLDIRLAGRSQIRSGTVLALTAPALEARTGVRLADARVGRRGTWRPRPRELSSRDGTVRAVVPGATAALIRLER
jgi:hypothetical protein